MTGTHQIGIEVDGGAEVTVTFTGRDYSTAFPHLLLICKQL